ncbi:MAG: nucleotidyl transferase AbiEii/AbiGii toxin family protein [Chlamydiae bacterium]|nr:nucleotidyl transferase AbiEii/AbiGii toxin family protein [Chlamydiota bacterium]MBI3267292.1 nucleotidyl transferase AbiEii/AbiGii toxin family protein [Chlamydiota bacterium]
MREIYSSLQLREIFHLEFLRWFSRKMRPKDYGLKGGANLRFFFKSFRYSEDMDLDISTVSVGRLKKVVMKILTDRSFGDTLKPFGIDKVIGPDLSKAKQTETTQRFKVHLITLTEEDLFTKIEFSRRGLRGRTLVGAISDGVLRSYKMLPLVVSHYDIHSAIVQKVDALASRSLIQARDIFDIYILYLQDEGPQTAKSILKNDLLTVSHLKKAYENIFEIHFKQFRDTVVAYLSVEDQAVYDQEDVWSDIQLKTAQVIQELRDRYV